MMQGVERAVFLTLVVIVAGLGCKARDADPSADAEASRTAPEVPAVAAPAAATAPVATAPAVATAPVADTATTAPAAAKLTAPPPLRLADSATLTIQRADLPWFAGRVKMRWTDDERIVESSRFDATWTSTVHDRNRFERKLYDARLAFVLSSCGSTQCGVEIDGGRRLLTVFHEVNGWDPATDILVVWAVHGERLVLDTILDRGLDSSGGGVELREVAAEAGGYRVLGLTSASDGGWSITKEWTGRWSPPRQFRVTSSTVTDETVPDEADMDERLE